ncbi:MAG: MFS transporter, partial [Chloroflexota bacterium]|nr:MFS transporter [Chloroflexota bacterium]
MSQERDDPVPLFRLPRGLGPLGYRNFGLYFLGQAGTNAGNWMEQTAVVWVLYRLTDSAFLLGLVGVARALPFFVFSPIAGTLSDRLDQRKMLYVTQGSGLVMSLALGILVASGHVQAWHVYLQVFLQTTISAFDATTRQSLFPRLVPRTRISAAVTLNSTAARTSNVIGPAIAGILLASIGDAAPFFANALTFLILIGALALMRDLAPPVDRARASMRGEFREGLAFMFRSPVLLALLKLEGAFSLFSANPVIIAIVARKVLDTGAAGLGELLSAPGLGALISVAVLMWTNPSRRQGAILYVGAVSYIAVVLLFAASHAFALTFAALIGVGFFDSLVSITRASVIQLAAPPKMRGRVIGNALTINRGFGPLAQTQSGTLASLVGAPLALVGGAGAIAIAVVASLIGDPELRSFGGEAASG